MLGMELTIPGKQIVLDAIAEGLLINCTHEKVLPVPAALHSDREGNRRGSQGVGETVRAQAARLEDLDMWRFGLLWMAAPLLAQQQASTWCWC